MAKKQKHRMAKHVIRHVAISTGNSLLSYVGMGIAGFLVYKYILPVMKSEGINVPGMTIQSTGISKVLPGAPAQ